MNQLKRSDQAQFLLIRLLCLHIQAQSMPVKKRNPNESGPEASLYVTNEFSKKRKITCCIQFFYVVPIRNILQINNRNQVLEAENKEIVYGTIAEFKNLKTLPFSLGQGLIKKIKD